MEPPELSASSVRAATAVLLLLSGALAGCDCNGGETDGGPGTDAANTDTGAADSGDSDAGTDAGSGTDSGTDSGTADSAVFDAAVLPGGDADGDGITNADEGFATMDDADGDGVPNYLDDDSDGDGIPDIDEAGDSDPATAPADHDADGTPDFLDLDSDDDSIPDATEGTDDPDGDGLGNWIDIESDGDAIADIVEGSGDPDGDGIPNYLDLDSDDDFIVDVSEGTGDPDGDGVGNWLDTDSDGDGILDVIERANPLCGCNDTDGDGIPDFLDLDSDGDTLSDLAEGTTDVDGDGIPNYRDLDSDSDGLLDLTEASTCTDPVLADTDMDGFTDLAEVAIGTDPCDIGSIIPDFFFVLPDLASDMGPTMFSTNLNQVDVQFNVDTTSSMSGEIINIQSNLVALIIPGIQAAIPDSAFGVSEYEDFPYNVCFNPAGAGCPDDTLPGVFGREPADASFLCAIVPPQTFDDPQGDRPFKLLSQISVDPTDALAGVNALFDFPNAKFLGCGLDLPESSAESLYQIATGAGFAGPPFDMSPIFVDPVVPTFIPDPARPGVIGGVGFRDGSLPLVLHIGDALTHDPVDYGPYFAGTHSLSDATTELNAISARVVGVDSCSSNDGIDCNSPFAEMSGMATATGAEIPACAWDFDPSGMMITRPAGCAASECCTGIGAIGLPPPAPGADCPLVFQINPDGTALGQTIVDAIELLVSFSTVDVTLNVYQDPANPGGLCMLENVTPIGATNPFPGCAPGATSFDPNPMLAGDEGFNGVTPGMVLTFQVEVTNDCVPQDQDAHAFGMFIDIIADGVTVLDTERVTIIVPPLPPPGQ